MEAWKEELYHHGILGMRWGKRNGPPYPLGAGDHSASEKKAGWQKSLDKAKITDNTSDYRKALNKADQKRAENYADYLRQDLKREKASSKRKMAEYRGNKRKAEKYAKKEEKHKTKANQYKESNKHISKEMENVIKAAKKSGKEITSKDIVRYTNKGELFMTAYGFGALGAAANVGYTSYNYGDKYRTNVNDSWGRSYNLNQNKYFVKGTKYSVKKKR